MFRQRGPCNLRIHANVIDLHPSNDVTAAQLSLPDPSIVDRVGARREDQRLGSAAFALFEFKPCVIDIGGIVACLV